MTQPDFEVMTKEELRVYVLEHREDNEAFYALMDKLNVESGIRIRSPEHLAELNRGKAKSPRKMTSWFGRSPTLSSQASRVSIVTCVDCCARCAPEAIASRRLG